MACETELQELTEAAEEFIEATLANDAAQANAQLAMTVKNNAMMIYQQKLTAYNACVQGEQPPEQTRPKNKGNVG